MKSADTARRNTCRFADSVKLLVLDWIKSCRILLLVPVDQLAGFLLHQQPCREAILEVVLALLALGDRGLGLQFFHQGLVLFPPGKLLHQLLTGFEGLYVCR